MTTSGPSGIASDWSVSASIPATRALIEASESAAPFTSTIVILEKSRNRAAAIAPAPLPEPMSTSQRASPRRGNCCSTKRAKR